MHKFGSLVALGDKFALASGLMEITYDTGARVILQGPVNTRSNRPPVGFYQLGKLTAKMEKGSGCRVQGSEIPNPSSLIPHPLFSVRTPTATVTDLGTEFGVEVQRNREENVVVLQGQVRVAVHDGQGAAGQVQTLQAGEAGRIDTKVKAATVIVGRLSAETRSGRPRVVCSRRNVPANVAAVPISCCG